jgi:hypothetical protein
METGEISEQNKGSVVKRRVELIARRPQLLIIRGSVVTREVSGGR